MNQLIFGVASFLAVCCLSFGSGVRWEKQHCQITQTAKENQQLQRSIEHMTQTDEQVRRQSQTLSSIGMNHENDRDMATLVPDSVLADLHAERLRLRRSWAQCESERMSIAATPTSQRHAATQRREEFAAVAVRIARQADDQLRACQSVILALTKPTPMSSHRDASEEKSGGIP